MVAAPTEAGGPDGRWGARVRRFRRSEAEVQADAKGDRRAPLLFLGAEFASDRIAFAAAEQPEPAEPAVASRLGEEGEGRSGSAEMGDGLAHLPAEDLAPPALQLHPEPAAFQVRGAETVACGQRRLAGEFVAAALGDGQVHRIATAGLGVAVLAQPVIIDRSGGAEYQAAELQLVGEAGGRRVQV